MLMYCTARWEACHFSKLPAELREEMRDLNVAGHVTEVDEEQQEGQADFDDSRFTENDIVKSELAWLEALSVPAWHRLGTWV